MAIVYAVACLLCSAGNDFIFKLFARKKRSRGSFLGSVGLVWFLVMLAMLPLRMENWQTTLFWGCASGFLSVSANILLIEAMGMQSAGICSTVYRLNLVPAVLGAWLLLEEEISGLHWLGIATAVAAVLCFLTLSENRSHRFARLGIILVVIAAFFRAGMGIEYRYAFTHGADTTGVMLINALFWTGGGLLYACFRERELMKIDRSALLYSLVNGLFVVGVIYFMAAGLACGKAGVVLPIAQMSFPGTLLLSALFLKEKITYWKLAGIACGVAAILLLSLPG